MTSLIETTPLVDLKKQYNSIQKEIDHTIKEVLLSGNFILGEEVARFEEEFARFCVVKYAVGLDSGLSALELGMHALGIGVGDEVLVPANSFIASASAVSFVGAQPVLVDCLEDTYTIDCVQAASLITKKTKALMVVHLYGQMADMRQATYIAKKHKLFLIEDACQAHGALYKGKPAGSFGDFAAFSFYPAKNLGAYGDGGILTTNKKIIADQIRMMRNYGQKEKYIHHSLAWNKRLDNLQAAILRVKLKKLKSWNTKRQKKAALYTKYLQGAKVVTHYIDPAGKSVFHLYVIRAKNRNTLAQYLKSKGVATGIHYPIPIHLQKAYKHLGYKKGDFPVAEKIAQELLSLPLYPELRDDQIVAICKLITEFYRHEQKN